MLPRFHPPTKIYSGYIFDCDGTLADTMPLHYQAWRSALEAAGAQVNFTWEVFTSRAGMTLEQTVAELSEQFHITLDPVTIAEHQRNIYRSLETRIAPIVEVLTFAQQVSQFAPLSVASGSTRPTVERTLTQIGARELFPLLITPEDVERGKPEPDLFLLAAERMGIPPSECLVIEDGEFGFEAARRAGMDYAVVQSPAPQI